MFKYTLLTAAGAALSYGCCLWLLPDNSLWTFLGRLCIVCILFPTVWVAATFRTEEFRGMLRLGGRILGKFLPGRKTNS